GKQLPVIDAAVFSERPDAQLPISKEPVGPLDICLEKSQDYFSMRVAAFAARHHRGGGNIQTRVGKVQKGLDPQFLGLQRIWKRDHAAIDFPLSNGRHHVRQPSDLQQGHIFLWFQSPIFQHGTKQQIRERAKARDRDGFPLEFFGARNAGVDHEFHGLAVVGAREKNKLRSFHRRLEKYQARDARKIQLARHVDRNQLDALDIDHFRLEAVFFKKICLFGCEEWVEVGAGRRVAYPNTGQSCGDRFWRIERDQCEETHQPYGVKHLHVSASCSRFALTLSLSQWERAPESDLSFTMRFVVLSYLDIK